MRQFVPLVLLAFGCARPAPVVVGGGDEEARGAHGTFPDETVAVGAKTRAYRLVAPASVDLRAPAPLVVAFHGMLIDGKDVMPQYTKLDDLAAAKGFVLAYPEAEGRAWGLVPDKVRADLAFFDALLADVRAKYRIDPARVYVLGMSNGGYFAHLVARERSHTVAACAAHSGPLGLETLLGVRAARKFPVMIVHGDRDPILSVAFARENRDKYAREGHEVNYVEVPGLGHEWATRERINEQLWDFFASHPKK